MNLKLLYSFDNSSSNIFLRLISLFYILVLNRYVSSTIVVYDEKNVTLNTYDDLAAGFGPSVPDDGFDGYISVAKPLDGCSKMEKPPNISYVNPKGWIALIQRSGSKSNCTFDLKVFNAQQAGYSAVIIYNLGSDNLIKMSSSGLYSIKIPAIFSGESTGLELKKYFTYENKTLIRITSDEADFNYLLIPFVCVVSICFIVAIFIFLIKFAIHCHKIRKNRFPRSALKKIPTKKYQKTDKYDTCPICLNEYEEGVKMRILPCEHAYHVECIDKWLLRNNRACPVCKRRVIPGSSSDSESEDGGYPQSTSSTNLLERQNRSSGAGGETQHEREENEPNEDDDTNESSRLLVTRNNNNDETSILTTSTNLLLNNMNNDMSSLNNQMTTSLNSNSNNLLQNSTRMELTSSKYGSISSINNLVSNSSTANNNVNVNEDVNNRIIKDSKATPSQSEFYYTPMDNPGLVLTESINELNSVNNNSAGVSSSVVNSKSSKSNNKSKKKNNTIKISSLSDNAITNSDTNNSGSNKKSKSKTNKKTNVNNNKNECSVDQNKLKSLSSSSACSILIDLNNDEENDDSKKPENNNNNQTD